ncbi:MAG: hypothetical protein MJZ21_05225 [archaeon]|nr:hypothetical protein [archaeon]
MATVSEDLFMEGREVLSSQKAEDIHKLGDRIISVEPDNWYGLYLRGCAYGYESDFSNCVENWTKAVNNLDDDSQMESMCQEMCKALVHCLTHVDGNPSMNFAVLGENLITVNDKLPESDDEVFVTSVLSLALEGLRANAPVNPLMTYYTFKALVMCSFRAYVELGIFLGFFEKLNEIAEILKGYSDPKSAGVIDANQLFSVEVSAAIKSALDDTPEDYLEKIEEYWLEHKTDSYMGHLQQAYQMSANYAVLGKFTGKLAKKVMLTEVQVFIKTYLNVKVN